MQQIKKLYRENYTGEDIVTSLTWENSQWNAVKEFAPSRIENKQISGRAVVIGNGPSRLELTKTQNLFQLLKKHKGGLLAGGAVQTYGCNALYTDFDPDFLVCSNDMADEISKSGYCNSHIVYGTADAVTTFPGKFYLTPQNPGWDAGAIAAYLACFDGHKQVYLMGFDCHSGEDYTNYNVYAGTRNYPKFISANTEEFFTRSLLHVMKTYSDVEFIRVMPLESAYTPERWKYQVNFRQVDFRTFALEVDL